jgi:hypothetical protein
MFSLFLACKILGKIAVGDADATDEDDEQDVLVDWFMFKYFLFCLSPKWFACLTPTGLNDSCSLLLTDNVTPNDLLL